MGRLLSPWQRSLPPSPRPSPSPVSLQAPVPAPAGTRLQVTFPRLASRVPVPVSHRALDEADQESGGKGKGKGRGRGMVRERHLPLPPRGATHTPTYSDPGQTGRYPS